MANDIKLAGTRRKSLTTMMAALLAGSIAATAGGVAFAKTDGQAVDPAKFQQRIEKRVDKALGSTTPPPPRRKGHRDPQTAFKDMRASKPARREPQAWNAMRLRPSMRRRSSRSAPSR